MQMKGLVSIETVASRRLGSETRKFGIKRVDEGQVTIMRSQINIMRRLKMPDSGLFSDWLRNNTSENLHSNWPMYAERLTSGKC